MTEIEALERLKICLDCDDCLTCGEHDEAIKVATKVLEEKTEYMTWISVKDRLPEVNDYDDYLVTDGEYCWVGNYSFNDKAWDSITTGWIGNYYADGSFEYANITHWMPICKPPIII